MRLNSVTPKQTQPFNQTQRIPLSAAPQPTIEKIQDPNLTDLIYDKISFLSDEILLEILSKLPKSQRTANFLVSKRWLNLQGSLVRSIKLLDWDFLLSGRLFFRFPNLNHVDLVNGCFISPRNSGIFCTHKKNVCCDDEGKDWIFNEDFVLDAVEVEKGLRVLASECPNLRKLMVVNCSEMGLLSLAEKCPTLQELELLKCSDHVLHGIAACPNLQILRLTGIVDGLYDSLVSDVGLTILAQGCKSLVKLELGGCKGSYEGIKAIGQCCQMLEELTFCDHKMEDGWLPALSYCENLKILRFVSCKGIDGSGELDEDLGSCPGVERLHLEKCQLREKRSLRALFIVCHNVRKVVVKNCWGLNDDMFATSIVLRISDADVVLEPTVGTLFDSEDEARECYANYAKAKGFGAVTKTSRKREDGIKANITYGCHRSRNPKTTALNPVKSQPITKIDCKAAMNISLQVDGKWMLNSIELIHNHELDPDNVRYLKCNRDIPAHVKRTIELSTTAEIKLNKTISSCVIGAGA